MSGAPTVSVLMAIKDGEAFLGEALDSILAQTFTDFEFIIVDDGSSDATADILDGYGDARIKRLKNETPQGLTRSLNTALKAAHGTYIARQDADDRSTAERLQKQLDYLEAHADVGLVGSAYTVIDHKGRSVIVHRQPLEDTAIRWQMLFHNAFCHTSVMARRSVLEGCGLSYDPEFRFCQDYDLWSRLLDHTKAANISEPLVDLRLHDESVSALDKDAQNAYAIRVSQRMLQRLLPGREVSGADLAVLRRLYYHWPDRLSGGEVQACKTIFQAIDAFAAQQSGNRSLARQLTRNWSERILSALPLPALLGGEGLWFLRWILARMPLSVPRSLLKRMVCR